MNPHKNGGLATINPHMIWRNRAIRAARSILANPSCYSPATSDLARRCLKTFGALI